LNEFFLMPIYDLPSKYILVARRGIEPLLPG
jgi:hypothetical protein